MRRAFTLLECLISLALSGLALGLLGLFLQQMVEFSKIDRSDQLLQSARQALTDLQRELLLAQRIDVTQPSSRLVFELIEPSPARLAANTPWDPSQGRVQLGYFIDQGLRRQRDSAPASLMLAEAVGLATTLQGPWVRVTLAVQSRQQLLTLEAQAYAWNLDR